MKRKLMKNLEEWKLNERKKCVLLAGARQVGKLFNQVGNE